MSDTELPSKISDRAFDPYRLPRTPTAQAIVDEVIQHILNYEDFKGVRKRKRKETDLASFKYIVTRLVCALIHNHLISPERHIFISLSKQSNKGPLAYRPPDFTKVLPGILKSMTSPELAYVVLDKGRKGFGDLQGRRSTITCGKRLVSLIQTHNLWLDALTQDPLQQSIILKSSKESYFDKAQWIDYQDNSITQAYRAQMTEINRWLNDANIDYPSSHDKIVDTSKRFLRRVFNEGTFDRGGRLFGGFWLDLKKEERKQELTINDESIVTLDFSQACPKIAYGIANVPSPEFDAYTLPSWKYSRDSTKKIFNSMMMADHPLSRFPKGTKVEFSDNTRFIEIRDQILALHHPIAHLFGTGLGMRLMFIESQILIACLLECMNQGIVALPVHDALIVVESSKEQVREIMLNNFKSIAGVEGTVSEEGAQLPSSISLHSSLSIITPVTRYQSIPYTHKGTLRDSSRGARKEYQYSS